MNEINLSQISQILDNCLKEYKENGKRSNVIFVGHEGHGRSSTIEEWLDKNNLYAVSLLSSMPVLYRNNNGFLERDLDDNGNIQLVFNDDGLKKLTRKGSVLFEERITWRNEQKYLDEEINIIRERKYTTSFGKEYDMSRLFLVVATAFPDNKGYDKFSFIREEDLKLFDVYNVKATLSEVANHLIEKNNNIINKEKEDIDLVGKLLKRNELLEKLAKTELVFPDYVSPFNLKMAIAHENKKVSDQLMKGLNNFKGYIENLDEEISFINNVRDLLNE